MLAFSAFHMLGTGTSSPVMEWFSVSNQHYRIRRSSNLTNGFGPLRTNFPATPPMNVHTDATAFGSGPWFYQVELE